MSAPEQQFVLPKLMDRGGVVARIARTLLGLPLNAAWRIEVHEQKSIRSQQQNRYLWGVVYPAVGKFLPGWDSEDIHEYFLGECFGWETLEGFGRRRLRPLKRSSRLSKLEFSDYVGFIQRRAAEHGIFVPDADPEWWPHDERAA